MRKLAVFIEKVKFQYGRVWAVGSWQLGRGKEGEETEAEEREQDQMSGKARRGKRGPQSVVEEQLSDL